MDKVLLAKIFDTWADRYAADPESFDKILDEDGKVIEGYGDCCAQYFIDLEKELQ